MPQSHSLKSQMETETSIVSTNGNNDISTTHTEPKKQINYADVYARLKKEYETKLKQSDDLSKEFETIRKSAESYDYKIGQLLDILGVLSDNSSKDKIKVIELQSLESKQRLAKLIKNYPHLKESLELVVNSDFNSLKSYIEHKNPKLAETLFLAEDRITLEEETQDVLKVFLDSANEADKKKKRAVEDSDTYHDNKKQKVTNGSS